MTREDIVAYSYLNEYRNLGQLANAPATYDYKKYMATSLIKRGFLFQNSKNIEELYRASIDELFSTQFKNLLLYAVDRDISDVYGNITNVKNMGPIGTHDFLSSVFGLIPAKFIPIFEPFKYENMLDDENIEVTISPERKRNIILQRAETQGASYTYTKLTAFDKIVGPDVTQTYFVNPKIPDTIEYDLVDTTATPNPNPNTEYYKKNGDVYEKTTDFDIVDEYNHVSGTDITLGPILATNYYEKLKNPNTVNYIPASGEPLLSTQYYIKDPSDPTRFITTDNFNDKKEYVKIDSENTKFPIPGLEYFVLNSNRVYVPCTDENFTPLYSYTPVPQDYQYDNDPSKFYIKNNENYRLIDSEVDLIKIPIMGTTIRDVYNEVLNKEEGPQPNTTYYVHDLHNDTYHEVSNDNLVDKDVYEATLDSNYNANKDYYVKNENNYRHITENDLNVSTDTTTVPVDVYNETSDEDYVDGKTYYLPTGEVNVYRQATDNDFVLVENTEEQNVDHYNEVDKGNISCDESETYYVSDGNGGYRTANNDDFVETPITSEEEVVAYNIVDPEEDAYDPNETYYVSDGDGGYEKASDEDFDITQNTTSQFINHYNPTSDESYDNTKTYYVSDGNDGYKEATDDDFTKETVPAQYDYTSVDTSNTAYNPDEKYYVSDDNGSYKEASRNDFANDDNGITGFKEGVDYYIRAEISQEVTTIAFTNGTTYYEKTITEEEVPDGTKTTSFRDGFEYYTKTTSTQTVITGSTIKWKDNVTYYTKTTSLEQVGIGTYVKHFRANAHYYEKTVETQTVPAGTVTKTFKIGIIYYELTGTVKAFDSNVNYYTKSTVEEDVVDSYVYTFNSDYTYYTRNPGYENMFTPGVNYYKYEIVGKLFIPTIQYYTKQVIDNGYRYETTNDFESSISYRTVDTTVISAPLENAEYYTLENNEYVLAENLTSWEPDKTYYSKVENLSFKQDKEYYTKETVQKFKVMTTSNPGYEYYTARIVDNGYDTSKYEIATVTDSFEDRDYYIGNIDFENTELTPEEIANLRKELIISKINEEFDFHIRDVLTTAKEIFQKHKLRDIAQSVHMGASDYELYSIRILYKKILSAICTMVYAINVSEYLDDTCVVYKLINESIEKLLSKVRIIGEMIPTKMYYSKKVLKYYISDSKKEELMYHYGISSPFADLVDINNPNITIEDMTMKFTENLITLRTMLERTDLVHESDTNLLFGMFTLVYNIIVQLFFNSAYLSRNRTPIIQSANELFKRFNPNYDNIIAGSSLKDFIKFNKKE